MIAGSGFTLTRITDIFRDTVSSGTSTMQELADAMYEVTISIGKLKKEIQWIDIFMGWWAYIRSIYKNVRHSSKAASTVKDEKPDKPKDYG